MRDRQMAQTTTVYGSEEARDGISNIELRDEEMSPRLASRFIQDELLMDGTPSLNLASFVTTYMDEEAEQLMLRNISKNHIDAEEYPSCSTLETRCVNIIGRLFNAPQKNTNEEVFGTGTVGSSEAIFLAVLAAKRRWMHARRAANKPTDKPNIVMSAAVQVCWEKAARYLELEEKLWYCKPGKYIADPQELVDLVDENTVVVCAILGSTYTGQYEDIKAINDCLERHNRKHKLDVYIHVDAASGGFVAPFVNPNLVWDFRLSRVASINVSGHKYGLTYAGVGWAIWREKSFVPDDILFTVNYLGAAQTSFTLNFSKSAIHIIGQYYQLLRLGRKGFTAIITNLTILADYLTKEIGKIDGGKRFEILSATNGQGLPVVSFRLKQEESFDEFDLAAHLRQRGWIVPAYNMAPKAEQMKMLRVVIRGDFSKSRCVVFLKDLLHSLSSLDSASAQFTKLFVESLKLSGNAAARHRHGFDTVKKADFKLGKQRKAHIC